MWLHVQVLAQVSEHRAAKFFHPGNTEAAVLAMSYQLATVMISQCVATAGEQDYFGARCHQVPRECFR